MNKGEIRMYTEIATTTRNPNVTKLPTMVMKRDGQQARFDTYKILSAVQRAGLATGEFAADDARQLTAEVLKVLRHRYATRTLEIEQIQDVVEQVLITSDHYLTARAYIIYREQHGKLRQDQKSMIDVESSMNEYLEQLDWRVSANANQGYSLGGLILNTAGRSRPTIGLTMSILMK